MRESQVERRKGDQMSKIIRLNNETMRLIEIVRQEIKEDFEANEMTKSMKDVLDNDNLIIQSALRTAIEFHCFLMKKTDLEKTDEKYWKNQNKDY